MHRIFLCHFRDFSLLACEKISVLFFDSENMVTLHLQIHIIPMANKQQGVYKFNRTNFQEIPGGISRKIQDMFALLRPAM